MGSDKDGRVEGCETHLPPQNPSKINLHVENSHGKLIGNRKKNSYTTKAARKISTSSGRTQKRHRVRTSVPGAAMKGEKLHMGRPFL